MLIVIFVAPHKAISFAGTHDIRDFYSYLAKGVRRVRSVKNKSSVIGVQILIHSYHIYISHKIGTLMNVSKNKRAAVRVGVGLDSS